MKITVVSPDDGVFVELVTDTGEVLCRVSYDDQPEEVLHKVAASLCKLAGFEFEES